MIICFACSPDTKRTLDSLLESGQYKDYSEAISLAIMNLAVIHEEVLKSGAVVFAVDTETGRALHERAMPYAVRGPEGSLKESDSTAKSPAVPAVFSLDGLTDSTPPLGDLPDDVWAIGQEIPLDRWIFGQYNRLLPAKASCRGLARLLLGEPKGILLEEAARRIAEEATALGEFLTHNDKRNSITRDGLLSTAFPSTGENSDKSRSRYAHQFVASVNKQGQVSGLLIDLKLINYSTAKATRLLLTEVGWQFATMANPILDGFQETPTQKFSGPERDFLLSHISRSVPVEDFAYRAVLTAITEGHNTPDTMDEALLERVPRDTTRNFSKSFLSSQRSGAISRMTDLALVARVRDGVRVSYTATDIGEEYMRNGWQLS